MSEPGPKEEPLKSGAPTDASQRLLAEEWRLFNDPEVLKDGVVLMSEENMEVGKLVMRLVDLPEGKVFRTPLGNRIVRTSSTQVTFAEGRVIEILPEGGNLAPTKEETAKDTPRSQKARKSRARSASQSDSPGSTKLSSMNLDRVERLALVAPATLSASFGAPSTTVYSSSSPASPTPASPNTNNVFTFTDSPALVRTSSNPEPRKSSGMATSESKTRLGALDLSTGARILKSLKTVVSPSPEKPETPTHRPPQLLPGEKELFVCHEVEYVVSDKVVHPGSVFLTNYQVLFRASDTRQSVREVSLAPLGKITRVEKVGGKKSSILSSSLTRQLVIHCKDFHKSIVIRMASANAGQRKQLFELINRKAFPGDIPRLFAFAYDPPWSHPIKTPSAHLTTLLRSDVNIGVNGWNLFSFEAEFKRIGVFERHLKEKDHAPAWRWSDVNANYMLCKSYPERFVVPHAISDAQLHKVANFRTQSRIPILSWIHKNGASITRCSQPKSGLVTSRCTEDEILLGVIRDTAETPQYPLVIIDPRPRTNAEANRAVGAGYEKEANYTNTKVHFMGIANIHVVRDSQQTLAALCAQISPRTDAIWLSGVEGTGWLKHVKNIVSAASHITKCILHGASCLVHCSDGWDRTSQVVSLAMLCMDPFYRTISGFCILIEKEWVHAGHMFATRHGHASKNYGEDSRAPIFLQWIDCVWQVFRQFVTSFEFNENFLIRVVEEVCNCRFGTFLADNQQSQREMDLPRTTVSLWTYIHHKDNFYRFTNPLYSPPVVSSTLGSKSPGILFPKSSIFALSFWSNSYLQGSNFRDRVVEMSMERAFEMNCKIEDLEVRIAELEKENALLRGTPVQISTPGSPSSSSSPASTLNLSPSGPATSSSSSYDSVGIGRAGAAAAAAAPPPRDSGDMVLDLLVQDLASVGPNRHPTSLNTSIGLPLPSSSTPEPASSADQPIEPVPASSVGTASVNGILPFEDDVDWQEALAMDTPRVRGIPQWGAADMMIEDYTSSKSEHK